MGNNISALLPALADATPLETAMACVIAAALIYVIMSLTRWALDVRMARNSCLTRFSACSTAEFEIWELVRLMPCCGRSAPSLLHVLKQFSFCPLPYRKNTYDLDKLPGPWKKAYPVVGNLLDCLTPDFHRKLLEWSDQYGGIYRMRFLWHDAIVVTDPLALGTIMGRGEHAIDKAFATYAPINKMCDPHGHANLLTAPADDKWKIIRKAVAVSFSAQNIKRKFPVILEKVNEVVVRTAALGPQASIDVDQTALRVTLDVIGLVSIDVTSGSQPWQDTPFLQNGA
jgi:hypothetical protein